MLSSLTRPRQKTSLLKKTPPVCLSWKSYVTQIIIWSDSFQVRVETLQCIAFFAQLGLGLVFLPGSDQIASCRQVITILQISWFWKLPRPFLAKFHFRFYFQLNKEVHNLCSLRNVTVLHFGIKKGQRCSHQIMPHSGFLHLLNCQHTKRKAKQQRFL